jgi:outer membrane lipopolysaccharide assembly protein LptE/RlpB
MPFGGRFSGEVMGFCGFRLRDALSVPEAVRETDVMVNKGVLDAFS